MVSRIFFNEDSGFFCLEKSLRAIAMKEIPYPNSNTRFTEYRKSLTELWVNPDRIKESRALNEKKA